jgi:hypothetical protein
VDGDPSDVLAAHLDFARVHPGADLETEGDDRIGDRLRAPDSAGGAVEHGEEAVAGRFDLI